jgi:hypothetical protein
MSKNVILSILQSNLSKRDAFTFLSKTNQLLIFYIKKDTEIAKFQKSFGVLSSLGLKILFMLECEEEKGISGNEIDQLLLQIATIAYANSQDFIIQS